MNKENIYRSDDILLLIGKILTWILIIPVIITLIAAVTEKADAATVTALLIMTITPAAFIVSGRIIRKKEKQILVLYRILRENPEVFINDITNSTNMTRESIIKTTVLLNSRGLGFFVFEPESDSILNSRLRARNIIVEKCPGCGSIINMKVPLNLSQIPHCPYCNNPIDVSYLNTEKTRIIDNIVKTNSEPQIFKKEKKINIFILILLILFFWPAAVFYVIRHSKQSGHIKF